MRDDVKIPLIICSTIILFAVIVVIGFNVHHSITYSGIDERYEIVIRPGEKIESCE